MRWKASSAQWQLERPLAKGMRLAPTEAERRLWGELRRRRLAGLRFRRQHVIGRFIVDFYGAESRLVVEVDGGVHEDSTERDGARTELLQAHGFTVLRFSNDDVFLRLQDVLDAILSAART